MGNPYLNRGESIILTAHRISVNAVLSDVMLTSQRLIVVDTSFARFEPQTLPLATIVKVMSGVTVTDEPIITLSLTARGDTGHLNAIDLIFSQQSGERRKRECDEWVKKLMGNIVSVRQEATRAGTRPADQETGIQPLIRHWIAPEKLHPRTTVVEPCPALTEVVMTPMQPGSPAEQEEAAGTPEIIEPSVAVEEGSESADLQIPEISHIDESAETPEEGSIFLDTEAPVSPITGAPSVIQETEAVLPDSFTRTILAVLSSLTSHESNPGSTDMAITITQEITESPTDLKNMMESSDTAFSESRDTIKPAITPQEERDSLEVIHRPEQDVHEPSVAAEEEAIPSNRDSTAEPESMGATEILKDEPGPADGATHIKPAFEESPVVPKEEPAIRNTATSLTGEEKILREQPVRKPIPPSPGSGRHIVIVVMGIILALLVMGGGVFLISHYLLNGTTVPDTSAIIPMTPIQQTPTPPQVIIPQTGVWVRVIYPGHYGGWVGNPGSLQGVSGSGDKFYMVRNGDGIVQASIQKKDNSGDMLTVMVYNNGEMISRRTVTAPMGVIDILVDARTGNPPGITPVITNSSAPTGSNSSKIMYF